MASELEKWLEAFEKRMAFESVWLLEWKTSSYEKLRYLNWKWVWVDLIHEHPTIVLKLRKALNG